MNLKERRVQARLSQAKLAQQAGVDPSTIWRAEKGREITRISAEKICSVLGISVKEVENLHIKE